MSDEIIDVNEVLDRVQNDKDLLVELLDIFKEDFLEKRKLLEQALKKTDWEQLKSVAHSLKGASGNISAKRINSSLIRLEQLAKNKDSNQIVETFKALDQQYSELKTHIERIKGDFKKY